MPVLLRLVPGACILIALMGVPGIAVAQSWTFAAGPSIPRGPMRERRAIGGQAAVSFGSERETRGFRYRVEIAYGQFPIRSAYAATLPAPGEGTLSVGSGSAYLLYGGAPGPLSFHAGLGAGAYDMRISGRPNPRGAAGGLGSLFGATIGSGRVSGLVEFHLQAILSDYGNKDFEVLTFAPVRFGIVVQ